MKSFVDCSYSRRIKRVVLSHYFVGHQINR